MKIITTIPLFILLLLTSSISCKDDEENRNNPGEETADTNRTPFQGVPDTEDIIMYEINLRAFSSTGDFQGVIMRMDSVAALGVNVIWMMPIHPIGKINSVNSPYSVRDYKAVNPEFGTMEDFNRLTDSAHARGIAVIIDWVANHTAWDNEWISNKSWYSQDNNGNIIHPAGTNWLDVADLNYDNHEMRAAMIDAMKYWICEANIDGFRCDYADGVPFDFWKQAWDSIHAIPGRKFILLAEGARTDHFDAGFDLNFSWQFYTALKDIYCGQSAGRIFTVQQNEYNNLPDGKHWLRFTTNHDESAWDAPPVVLFNGIDGALAASVVTIFTGGVPLLYAGQEVGTDHLVPFFSNSMTEWDKNPEMKTAYQVILQFYSGSVAAKKGTNSVYAHHDVACFKKTYDSEDILIIVNLRNCQTAFDLPVELQNSNWSDGLTNQNILLENQITLDPYSYLILK